MADLRKGACVHVTAQTPSDYRALRALLLRVAAEHGPEGTLRVLHPQRFAQAVATFEGARVEPAASTD